MCAAGRLCSSEQRWALGATSPNRCRPRSAAYTAGAVLPTAAVALPPGKMAAIPAGGNPGATASTFGDTGVAEILSREERVKRFGIDCGDGLCWAGGTWGPGGEFIKNLTVKNLSERVQKIKYRVPDTKFFYLDFPEVIRLAPGNHKNIEVRFRPIRLEEYDDFIEFKTDSGKFKVPICSRLAVLKLKVPDRIDFGCEPVNEVATRTFLLENVGQIPGDFEWVVDAPFSVEPAVGSVEAGKAVKVTISFAPKDASVFEADLEVDVNGGSQKLSMHVEAIGKYPHFLADNNEVDFGDQLVGQTGPLCERIVTLTNYSLVHATWEVKNVESDRKSQFVLSPRRGVLPAGESMPLKVTYLPRSAGMYTDENFDLVTPGGNTLRIRCLGFAAGPAVSLFKKEAPGVKTTGKPNALNFGDIKTGQASSRVLFLKNDSNCEASFHFQCEQDGVFHFDRVQGVIPPLLSTFVTIVFRPEKCLNYYRRVFCLIRDQSPLFVDMVGTGHDEKVHPMPLTQKHVDAYRNRPDHVQKMGPTELDEYIARNGGFDPTDETKEAEAALFGTVSRSGEATLGELDVQRQYFVPATDPSLEVALHEELLDFGAGSRTRSGERKVVHLRNNTRAKVTVVWHMPPSVDPDDEVDWDVSPATADIAPGKTIEFRVAFRPSQDNFYYSQDIEAHVFYKSNRTFRLVNHASFTPPWCLPLRVLGHTFGDSAEQFLPKVAISLVGSPPALDFPPCHLGDQVYQTFQLTNSSDTPAVFSFPTDPSGVFTVRPSAGVIQSNAFQLVSVRFRPKLARMYTHVLKCLLNNSEDAAINIRVTGAGNLPHVRLEGSGMLYFKPTCMGATSRRTSDVINLSRIPLRFRWRVPERVQEELRIRPGSGVLRGNETLPIRWSFAPRAEKQYSVRIPLEVFPVSGNTEKPVQVVEMRAVGEGAPGALQFDPPALKFGTVLVNDKGKRPLVIENLSDATLRYEVSVIEAVNVAAIDTDGDGIVEAHELEAHKAKALARPSKGHRRVIRLDDPVGTIEARSRFVTHVHFTPRAAGHYQYRLFYQVKDAADEEDEAPGAPVSESRRALEAAMPALVDRPRGELNADPMWCEIDAFSGYPSVAFDDARLLSPPPLAAFPGADQSMMMGATTPGGDSVPNGFEGSLALPGSAGGTAGGTAATTTLSSLRVANDGSPWRLWKQFSLHHLNQSLALPLRAAEIAFNKATQMTRKPEELDTFVFEFTPATLGSSKMAVSFNVRNTSNLRSDVSFVFPTDQEVELEPWAEVGEPTREDVNQQELVEQGVFDVQPREASLAPGESVTVVMHYAYTSLQTDGVHELPVLVKLAMGKQVRLLLRGQTLEPAVPKLWFGNPREEFEMNPVPIGVMAPPVQSVELYNPSSVDVRYAVDQGPLAELQSRNYDFEILRCLNPSGVVPANSQTTLQFVFRPLEAAKYSVELDVAYGMAADESGAATGLETITVWGVGFAPDKPSIYSEPDAPPTVGGLSMGDGAGLEEDDENVGGDDKEAAERELRRALRVLERGDDAPDEDSGPQVGHGAKRGYRDGVPGLRGSEAWEELRWGGVGAGAHSVELARNGFFFGATPASHRIVKLPAEAEAVDGMAALSLDWLRFGDIPASGVAYRVVVVRNTRDHGSIQFRWDAFHPLIARRLVKVHPKEGRVPHGGHTVCKVTFSATCPPEAFSCDLPCVVAVPQDEVQAEAEAAAKKASEERLAEMRDAARNPSKVRETPHRSVIFRSTASRQAKVGMSSGTEFGDGGESRALGTAGGASTMDGAYATGSIAASRLGGTAGASTLQRGGTARSVRSRASRAARSDIGEVVVPPAPSVTIHLHITARVCDKQEFLLVHPASHLHAFFETRTVPAGAPPVPLDDAPPAARGEEESKAKAAAAPPTEGELLVEDVMSSLLQDLVNDVTVTETYETLPRDPVPLFGQLGKELSTPRTTPRDTRADERAAEEEEKRLRLAALRGGECRELVSRLMENTVLNVLKEAAHGEFNLRRPPLQVVRVQSSAAQGGAGGDDE